MAWSTSAFASRTSASVQVDESAPSQAKATSADTAPLALTSTRDAQKRMGFRSWQMLHRLSYVIAPLGIVHFVWREKKDVSEPLVYGAVLALLLAVRLVSRRR